MSWKLPEGLEALRSVWLWHPRSFPRETLASFRKLVCERRRLTFKHFSGSKPSGGLTCQTAKKPFLTPHFFHSFCHVSRMEHQVMHSKCFGSQNPPNKSTSLVFARSIWFLLRHPPRGILFLLLPCRRRRTSTMAVVVFFSALHLPLLLSFPFLCSSRDA